MSLISAESVVLITGAASGLGRAIFREFIFSGARRFILADLNLSALDFVVKDFTAQLLDENEAPEGAGKLEVFTSATNVTDEKEVRKMVEDGKTRFGRIDHSVHCAGIATQQPAPSDLADVQKTFDEVMNVNARGVFLCEKYVLGVMKQQELRGKAGSGKEWRGTVVNIASILGLVGLSSSAGYVASKHAVIGITQADAADYGKHGIRINAVCPGFCRTGLLSEETWDMIEQMVKMRCPIPRTGFPEEIANAVVWLSSEKASYVTGAAVPVDGGYTAV